MIRQTVKRQMVVIYDDHRWILNVLFALNKHIASPKLIYFDAHDDAAECEKKSELLKKIGATTLNDATSKQFGAFVDYDQRIDDGGWLTTAMELNLIGDVVNIGNKHSDNITQMNDSYISEDDIFHNVFQLSANLEYELGCRGSLGDSFKEEEFRKIRDFFDIEHEYINDCRWHIKDPYVLDFDLDFFTISCDSEPTHGWTDKILIKHFPLASNHGIFIRRLIDNASVITICREPDYCGSIGDSNRNLELLDQFYFYGSLGTDVTL